MATEISIVQGYKVVRAGEFVGNTVFGSACALREDLRGFTMGLKPLFDWTVQYRIGVPTLFGVERPGFAIEDLRSARKCKRFLGGVGIDLRIFTAELVLIDNMDKHPHMWQPDEELRPYTLLCASIKILEAVE